MSLVHNYQHMMNSRLSQPKNHEAIEVEVNNKDHRTRMFRNSSPELQMKHQAVFYKTQSGMFATPDRRDQLQQHLDAMEGSRTFDKSYAAYGKGKVAKA